MTFIIHYDSQELSRSSVREIKVKGQQLCNLHHPNLAMSNKVWINKEVSDCVRLCVQTLSVTF